MSFRVLILLLSLLPPFVGRAGVGINEILANSGPGLLDTIELHNPTDASVNIGYWWLTDDPNTPKKYQIPANTVLSAGGYTVFNEDQFNVATPLPGNINFALNSAGDDVYLFSGDSGGNLTGYSHGFAFSGAEQNVSFGRFVTSAGDEYFPRQISRTFGAQNSGPLVGPLVINEIMYHPYTDYDEFVEIRNISNATVLLYDQANPTNTWKIGGLGYTFNIGQSIPAGGYALITALAPATFRAKYNVPNSVQIFGPYTGSLQDNGERISLEMPDTPFLNSLGQTVVPYDIIDTVRYINIPLWPLAADGSGPSLQRTASSTFGDDPANWFADGLTAGLPNGINQLPTITSVTPSPVPGSNSAQAFTVNGTDFDANCTVTLRNLTTGAIYPNRSKAAQTATSISLNPNFGASAAAWSVEVINPGGSNSGQYQFSVGAAAVLTSVSVSGPASLSAGEVANYTATANYSNGATVDVTGSAAWSVTGGLSGTSMAAGTLSAGNGTASTSHITATFYGDTGTRSASMDVTIGTGWMPVFLNASATAVAGSNPQRWILNAGATNEGVQPQPSTTSWQLDGTPIAEPTNLSLQSTKGQHQLKVTKIDADGVSKSATCNVAFNVPAPVEPLSTHPPNDPDRLDAVYGSDGQQPFSFQSARISNGFLLIAHGMNANAQDPWVSGMATKIEARLISEGKQGALPNIALYDWRTNATPNNSRDWNDDVRNHLYEFTIYPGILGAPLNSVAILILPIAQLTYDFQHIEPLAISQGGQLADWMLRQINAGNVDPSKPIHLIGHSAGGFVVGEAATILKERGYIVDLVTMLDTPDPFDRHFTTFPNPGYVERYISSVLGVAKSFNRVGENQVYVDTEGSLLFGLAISRSFQPYDTSGSRVAPGQFDQSGLSTPSGNFYRRYVFWSYRTYNKNFLLAQQAHEDAHKRYTIDTVDKNGGRDYYGFWFSPFLNGPKVNKTGSPLTATQTSSTRFASSTQTSFLASASATISGSLLSGFQIFGNVSAVTNGYQIAEGDNAGIFKELAFSYGAAALRFKYSFTTPGDGDYLTVRVGDAAPIFVGLDSALTESGFVTAEVPCGRYANTTNTLVITLISRGNPNAVVQVTNLEIVESDDPDGDGLTTVQELALGTNPLAADTDGDGIKDGDEVNIYHTNPLLADTDGDGIPDGAEIAAGTDPNSLNSYFRVTNIQRNVAGGFALTWPCVAGKSYQVFRSTDITFASYDVIASGLEAVTSTLTYTDTSPLVILQGGVFYRVALGP